ncbi:MAG: DUF4249 family protein, partial [Bacteroidales bacterium]|nr:DUF4249 family protein [Bacteroidales bacterium]
MKYPHLIYLLLFLSFSCTTRFLPEIEEYDKIIVVEGLLTNENRTNHVKLSRTIPVGISG